MNSGKRLLIPMSLISSTRLGLVYMTISGGSFFVKLRKSKENRDAYVLLVCFHSGP